MEYSRIIPNPRIQFQCTAVDTLPIEQVQSYGTLVFGLPLLWPGLHRLKVSVKEQGDKSALFIGSSMAIQTA